MAQLLLFSPTQPTSTAEGRLWLNNTTGQIYCYSGSGWLPLCTGDPYQLGVGNTVFVDGVNLTANIDNTTVAIEDNLTYQINTCGFVIFDNENTISVSVGMDLLFYYRQSSSVEPELIFAGNITDCPKAQQSQKLFNFEYDISASDNSVRLKKDLAIDTYDTYLAGDIIKDLISKYSPLFTTDNVADGITIDYIPFNYKNIFDCIKEIAELTGYDWYVDYNWDIHFFSKATNASPYILTENSATSGHYLDLEISVNKSQLRNRIYVRGGTYLSDLYTQERVADGTQTSFNLDYLPRAPVSVYVDAGAGYVAKTLGIDNVDTSGKDFVVNYKEKVIKNLDYALLTAGHKIKITYKYDTEVLTQDDDFTSQDTMKAIEGGDGIYQFVIVDTSIETIESAHERASAELSIYANPIVSGSFKTDQYGYRSGQYLDLQLPNWGYSSSQYVIQSVSAEMREDSNYEYTINFATRLKNLTQLLIELIDSSVEIVVRENETVNDLASVAETITLTATDPTFDTELTPPFTWGIGSNDFGWNEGMWG